MSKYIVRVMPHITLIVFCMYLICSCNGKTDAQLSAEYDKKQNRIAQEDSIKNEARKIRNEQLFNKKVDTNLLNENNVTRKLLAYSKLNTENRIRIKTTFGNMELTLYDDTPIHRANFIHLIKSKYFDETIFYRVIDQFMIQGGNSDREEITDKMKKIGFYTLPNEIKSHHIHKRGAIAMAVKEQLDVPKEERHKRSSSFNFYIVQNGPMTDSYLDGMERRYGITIDGSRRSTYRKIGGVPHLDDQFTVFGEVTAGISVVDKIAQVKTDENDRPLKDIFLSIEIIE